MTDCSEGRILIDEELRISLRISFILASLRPSLPLGVNHGHGFPNDVEKYLPHLLKSVYDGAQLDEDVNAVATILDYLLYSTEGGGQVEDMLERIKWSWGAYLEGLAKANKESFSPGGPDCCTPYVMMQ